MIRFVPLSLIAFSLASTMLAQQPFTFLGVPVDEGATETPVAASTIAATPVVPVDKPLTERWLDLTTLSHSQRYRSSTNQGGWHQFEDGQQRSMIAGSIKLDAAAHYRIGFRASSGRYFNWSYADYAGKGFTGRLNDQKDYSFAGTYNPVQLQEIYASYAADPINVQIFSTVYSNGWEFYMRELYLSATPVKPVTVEFGSLGIERGLGSEITTFDDDGWVSGERVRLHAPKHLFFDEVGYTNAFFGDRAVPNLFDRGASLKSVNYRQVFLNKEQNSRLRYSADYTWQTGTDTLREAAMVGTKELRAVDQIRLEAYQRVDSVVLQGLTVHGGTGFAITGSKKFGPKFSGDVGFAAIDKDYSVYSNSRYFHAFGFSFNGDSYGQGKRPFTHASYKINSVVTAFGYYTHAVGQKMLNANQQGINAGFNFDLKALVNTEKHVF